MKKTGAELGYRLSAATDWLLILLGGLLIFKALVGIDVAPAPYVVLGTGAVFLVAGMKYRWRRKRRHRRESPE